MTPKYYDCYWLIMTISSSFTMIVNKKGEIIVYIRLTAYH